MKNGAALSGILWHQGESEAGRQVSAESYHTRLSRLIADLRSDLNAPRVPFIAGQLGEFLYTRTGNVSPGARTINNALARLPETVPLSGCALSRGLNHKGDALHFDAAAARELGRRYAAIYLRLTRALQ